MAWDFAQTPASYARPASPTRRRSPRRAAERFRVPIHPVSQDRARASLAGQRPAAAHGRPRTRAPLTLPARPPTPGQHPPTSDGVDRAARRSAPPPPCSLVGSSSRRASHGVHPPSTAPAPAVARPHHPRPRRPRPRPRRRRRRPCRHRHTHAASVAAVRQPTRCRALVRRAGLPSCRARRCTRSALGARHACQPRPGSRSHARPTAPSTAPPQPRPTTPSRTRRRPRRRPGSRRQPTARPTRPATRPATRPTRCARCP